jgi:hypothetical protein
MNNNMMTILHIASSLLLLPYGLLCISGIRRKLDSDAADTEFEGKESTCRNCVCSIGFTVDDTMRGDSFFFVLWLTAFFLLF